jgi:predicted nucleotidyltransferase
MKLRDVGLLTDENLDTDVASDNRMNSASATKSTPLHWGTDVTLRAIRRYVRQVAERFRPDQIILFGSHAYGALNADSDVDLLVVMPTRNPLDQALKIRLAIPAPFPLDLLVRTPETLKWRLEEGDCFLREIVSRGKVLYEKAHGRVGAKGGTGLPRHKRSQPKSASAP